MDARKQSRRKWPVRLRGKILAASVLLSFATMSFLRADDGEDVVDLRPSGSGRSSLNTPLPDGRGSNLAQSLQAVRRHSILFRGFDGEDGSWRLVWSESPDSLFHLVAFSHLQEVPPLQPLPAQPEMPLTPSRVDTLTANIFRGDAPRSDLRLAPRSTGPQVAADRILGIEAKARTTSDAGNLLGQSAKAQGVTTQKRNPIITDPRIRGSRVGQLSASGSYWVPTRIDLDTPLSKLDSRLISEINVVKGPYGVEYGPGFDFIDFTLATSPRSQDGPDVGGSTGLEYQDNGQQWYGRQTLTYAEKDWGARVGYGERSGSDYQSGSGLGIPSSYHSRDVDVALGFDLSEGQSLELVYLLQDQSRVELPGQAFDIDLHVTNEFEATWPHRQLDFADNVEVETWINDAHLTGNAQNPVKRQSFPIFNNRSYQGVTDVNSLSFGARAAATWQLAPRRELSAGTDVRVLVQELDEISSLVNLIPITGRNSPIPQSVAVNPGLFLKLTDQTIDRLTLESGIRGDLVTTEVTEDAARLQNLSTGLFPLNLPQILGTPKLDQTFGLGGAYVSAAYQVDDSWTLKAAAGHGQRAPSLTELYVAESYMFLLQNGLNTVTGDPRLHPERRWQIDLGAEYADDRLRARVNGFHAWVQDRITFEALNAVRAPPIASVDQVNLKYVNTDLATLLGFETDAEYQVTPWMSVFGLANFVRGTDQSRNGHFKTVQADGSTPGGIASTRDPTQVRGEGESPANTLRGTEPLPGIPPLEFRTGVRLNGTIDTVRWNAELSARIIDEQNRVARSLYETVTPGFTTWNLRTFWQLTDQLTLVAGVENFTDKNYREHFDFRSQNPTSRQVLQPGRNIYIGTTLVY